MGSGDLNLKKSWNPGLMKNQQKVWEAEQEALEERKKIKERQLEIQKERELNELKALQANNDGKSSTNRMDWMYDQSGVGDGGKLITSEAEEYLLGKKRVDSLVMNNDKVEEKKMGFDKLENQVQLNERDEVIKAREDPMQKIKAQQIKKLQEIRLQKQLEEEKKKDERRHRSHGNHSSHSYHDGRKPSRHGDDKSDRYEDERYRSDRHRSHRDDKYRSERHINDRTKDRDGKYRNERHHDERSHRSYRDDRDRDHHRDDRYRENHHSSRHRSHSSYKDHSKRSHDRTHSSHSADIYSNDFTRKRNDNGEPPRTYKGDYSSDYRDRDYKISDKERELRLREMLQNSQKMEGNRHGRINEEADQVKREEELRAKLLASKSSKSEDKVEFLQHSKRIIED